MKQMKYLLTLLVVSICTVQSAWADNVVANVTLKEKNSLSIYVCFGGTRPEQCQCDRHT